MYIACPRCNWHPPAHARWACACGHHWNTFDTHGTCPSCGRAHAMTQCHICHAWSDHEDWYHDDDGGLTVDAFIRQFERQDTPAPA